MDKLAICGGEPLRKRLFPSWPVFDEREEKALLEVLRSRTWGRPNPVGRKLQSKFCQYYGVKYAIPVTNGSVALEVALRTAGIGYGDEVITP
ncbi:MAG: hypothetical protein DRP73_04610, partial [Candidatus Omnitrophota bacterium]